MRYTEESLIVAMKDIVTFGHISSQFTKQILNYEIVMSHIFIKSQLWDIKTIFWDIITIVRF